MGWSKRCRNFLIAFAISKMNKYDEYLINYHSNNVETHKANVTVRQQAGGPDFLPIYVSPSFRYIIIYKLNGSKTFITTQCTISNHFLWPSLPLGGPKIWSKGSFWHVSILSPREKSKQNQSKNVISYDTMSLHGLVPIPVDAQKNSTHYSNKKLSKNGV